MCKMCRIQPKHGMRHLGLVEISHDELKNRFCQYTALFIDKNLNSHHSLLLEISALFDLLIFLGYIREFCVSCT